MLIAQSFRRAFQFSGRSTRAEYWQFVLLAVVLAGIALTLDVAVGNSVPTLTMLVMLVLMVPLYAVTFRRSHDRGYSGWWTGILWIFNGADGALAYLQGQAAFTPMEAVYRVLGFIALVGVVCVSGFMLFQFCLAGEPGANRFGPPPIGDASVPPTSDVGARAAAFVSKLGQGDPLAQIERLSKLHQAGALTDEEFGEQKTALLKRL